MRKRYENVFTIFQFFSIWREEIVRVMEFRSLGSWRNVSKVMPRTVMQSSASADKAFFFLSVRIERSKKKNLRPEEFQQDKKWIHLKN